MTTIKNWRPGGIHWDFDNGNHISTTWAPYSYSDNYDMDFEDITTVTYGRIEPPLKSTTVEIMIDCSPKLLKRLEKKYNDGNMQPFNRIGINDMLDIIKKVSKEIKS
jgi:hypothetical protein